MYSAIASKELKVHFLHKGDLTSIGCDKIRKRHRRALRREVIDLMAAFRESVEQTQQKQTNRTRGKKAAR